MTMTTNRRSPRGTFTLAVALCAGLLMTASPSLAQKININTADEEELSELPGIGAKLSENIVKDREQNGKFLVVDDLSRVPGVSERLVAKIRNKVTTGGNGALVVKEGEAIPDDVVGRIMASFGDEPSIREVQEAAVEYARANPDTVDGWRWRVRTNALLPQVRSYVIGDIDRDIRTRTNLDATDAVVETTDNDNSVRLALQATWDLDRLVFDRNELGVWRETMRMANLRDRVVDEVTRRYYERRRLQIDIKLAPPTELADRVRKELRIQELTADLDALTGGWFSGELEKSGKRPY
jgi:competence ComEA-like helix-hairpin-helix protein